MLYRHSTRTGDYPCICMDLLSLTIILGQEGKGPDQMGYPEKATSPEPTLQVQLNHRFTNDGRKHVAASCKKGWSFAQALLEKRVYKFEFRSRKIQKPRAAQKSAKRRSSWGGGDASPTRASPGHLRGTGAPRGVLLEVRQRVLLVDLSKHRARASATRTT